MAHASPPPRSSCRQEMRLEGVQVGQMVNPRKPRSLENPWYLPSVVLTVRSHCGLILLWHETSPPSPPTDFQERFAMTSTFQLWFLPISPLTPQSFHLCSRHHAAAPSLWHRLPKKLLSQPVWVVHSPTLVWMLSAGHLTFTTH